MVKIDLQRDGTTLTVRPEGDVDITAASQLEETINAELAGVKKLRLDFSDVGYISSAGLRVLLRLNKEMAKKEGMKITHVTEEVRETFEIVGLMDFLTVE